MKPFRVILYYYYATIADTETYRDEHHLFCVENNLAGPDHHCSRRTERNCFGHATGL
jgi:hypothetical protein